MKLAPLVLLATLAGPAAAVDYCLLMDVTGDHCGDAGGGTAKNVDIDGGDYEIGKGKYEVQNLRIGVTGIGTLVQNGGNNTVSQTLALGRYSASQGSYMLVAGLLVTDQSLIGINGRGSFQQIGGAHLAGTQLAVGFDAVYGLLGGSLTAGSLSVLGRFNQFGGTSLVTGALDVSYADLQLAGGLLTVGGSASFSHASLVMSGGELRALQGLDIGGAYTDGGVHTSLFLDGGTVSGDVVIRNGGALRATGGRITGGVKVTQQGPFTIESGTVRIGSLSFQQTYAAVVAGSLLVDAGVQIGNRSSLVLDGGVLALDGTLDNGGLIGGHGALKGRGRLQGAGNLIVDGGRLGIALDRAEVTGTAQVQAGARLGIDTERLRVSGVLRLMGGSVEGAGRLELREGSRLEGTGRIDTALDADGLIVLAGNRLDVTQDFVLRGRTELSQRAILAGGRIEQRGSLRIEQSQLDAELVVSGSLEATQADFLRTASLENHASAQIHGGASRMAALSVQRGARLDIAADAQLWADGPLSFADGAQIGGSGLLLVQGHVSIAGARSGRATSTARWQLGDHAVLELDASSPTLHDSLAVPLVLNGATLALHLGTWQPRLGDRLDLFDGAVSGQFSHIDGAFLAAGLRWDQSLLASTGELRVSAVPEPAGAALLLAGLLALGARSGEWSAIRWLCRPLSAARSHRRPDPLRRKRL